MRVLICGSREWEDATPIRMVITAHPEATFVLGGARGADSTAKWLCDFYCVKSEVYPADWKQHGKAAGPIRNRQMLDTGIDVVYAFKNGFDWSDLLRGGTENMVKIARAAGVPTYVISSA